MIKIQEALQLDVKNIDQKVGQIQSITNEIKTGFDRTSQEMLKPIWEKEKTAFLLAQNLVVIVVFPEYSARFPPQIFISFCQNLDIALNVEEEALLKLAYENQTIAVEFYKKFSRKVETALDRNLSSAFIAGENSTTLISILKWTGDIKSTISHIYDNLQNCKEALTDGGYVLTTVNFLIENLIPLRNVEIPIEIRKKLSMQLGENISNLMHFKH
jgi:hypothetical protein